MKAFLTSGLISGDSVQDQLSMGLPDLKGVLKVLKQFLGFKRVLTPLGHFLDQDDLLGDPPFARSEMLIRQDQVFTFLLKVTHRSTS
ncbi:hypothetical protein ACETIH_17530 [Microvirga arabica]|uniref:Uncharacterized protein n=1 Tax=Microvirga arabica TaxID=1128671 RepID=A0ABV6YB21_9HYPH